MRLVRLELCNWDIQANQVMVLQPGVNLLSGENGSGKTSILDAIKVVLGVTDLGADRSVEEYLRKRASPFAMIRLVADNRVDPATRRRPLDGLGRYDGDLATLAVVYEATDEGYQPKWYLLDGDVSPLRAGFDKKPFTRKSDYLDRLDRIGMGKSFRQLLRTPQGQIAGLCGRNPAELFDLLFDFIGGKQALDEWQALRARFESERRSRQDRADALERREKDLSALKERLEHHHRYRAHLERIAFLEAALPVCKRLTARRRVDEITARHDQLVSRRQAAAEAEGNARAAAADLRERLARAREDVTRTEEQQRQARAEEETATTALVGLRASHQVLDELRRRVAHLEPRDAAALEASRAEAGRAEASARLAAEHAREAITALQAERQRLDEGLLTPPEGIDTFRNELRKAEVPHHLLLELIEPTGDAETRHALESWLGDLRFAVAVPDVESFVRAVALARAGRFPYYVLAPDIRSPAPEGPHPFLDAVRVHDPRYAGLVRRVLRNVDWLREPVTDTFKQRGAVVDTEGYVLDRIGGRHQGTDRYFLGRDALERRRAEVDREIGERTRERDAHLEAVKGLQAEIAALDLALREEANRARWEASVAEHRQLEARLAEADANLDRLRQHAHAIAARLVTLAGDVRELEVELKEAERRATEEQRAGIAATREISALAPELEAARGEFAATDTGDAVVLEEVEEHARRSTPEGLASELKREEGLVRGFGEATRDPNLPANVRTLERQVADVRGELTRLDAQVDEARSAAERAHEQYVSATKRVFRAYFAALRESGKPLGFTLDGAVRPRDDGRFEVDLQVIVGEKAPVPYDSSALSGGQKAALSILMAMTTMRVHGDTGAAGFFVVDEPFSASDVHKIQELGVFLDQTGAQYLVSMPTTSDLARCGAWLQAVLTCTKTLGGFDAGGAPRLAPPVKCSYVVRHG